MKNQNAKHPRTRKRGRGETAKIITTAKYAASCRRQTPPKRNKNHPARTPRGKENPPTQYNTDGRRDTSTEETRHRGARNTGRGSVADPKASCTSRLPQRPRKNHGRAATGAVKEPNTRPRKIPNSPRRKEAWAGDKGFED